jgi:hypothetical protein
MKAKVLFCFLLIGLSSFLACEDRYVRIDDGFTSEVGRTADGEYIIIYIFFSFDCKVEGNDEGWDFSQTEMARTYLTFAFFEYVSKVFFPMHARRCLIEIFADEKNTLFSDGFAEYIKDNRNLKFVRVTSIRIML